MLSLGRRAAAPPKPRARSLRIALASIVLTLLALQVAAVYTEAINWDEFALLDRAERTLATGRLDAGGRPGLVVLALLPWARGCTDAVAELRRLRLVWVLFTGAYLAALCVLTRRLVSAESEEEGLVAALLAVSLLALAPPFLRWSVQVRTDQPALAAAVWAGVLFLGRHRSWRRPLFAGLLLGLGYLCSQKALYAGALVLAVVLVPALFAVVAGRVRRWPVVRAELARGCLLGAGLGAAVLTYHAVVSLVLRLPEVAVIEQELRVFDYYREVLGWNAYLAMLPGLWPQVCCLALLLAAVVLGLWRRRGSAIAAAQVALALVLGAAVARFHAAAFPYFWLTLGLFPALAFGLGWPLVRTVLKLPRARALTLFGLCLLAANAPMLRSRLLDTQRVQRDTMRFVATGLPATARGFQPEGALTCRPDPAPMPRMLSQHIRARFEGEGGEAAAAFVAEFRARPISFLVESWRLRLFPAAVRSFWRDHYVPYRAAVWVLGHRFRAAPGSLAGFSTLAAGPYRLWSLEDGVEARAAVDGRPIATGEALLLSAGEHQISFLAGRGRVLLALDAGAGPERQEQPFYSAAQTAELSGGF